MAPKADFMARERHYVCIFLRDYLDALSIAAKETKGEDEKIASVVAAVMTVILERTAQRIEMLEHLPCEEKPNYIAAEEPDAEPPEGEEP